MLGSRRGWEKDREVNATRLMGWGRFKMTNGQNASHACMKSSKEEKTD